MRDSQRVTFSRPFHGLRVGWRIDPTDESVGYCHSSAARTKLCVMNSSDLITVDPEILGGTPVFLGTRVPVNTLFEYLENDYSLEEFLECFPSVSRDLARQVLERSEHALLSPPA